MFKYILVLIGFMLCGGIVGAEKAKKQEAPCPNKTAILAHYTFINSQLQSKDKPLSALSCKSYANIIKNWIKQYPFIEVETEIDKSWYNKTVEFLDYIGNGKESLSTLKDAKKDRGKEYRKLEDNLEDAIKLFAELLAKPTPVEKKKLDKLRNEKRKFDTEKRRENAKKTGVIMPDED